METPKMAVPLRFAVLQSCVWEPTIIFFADPWHDSSIADGTCSCCRPAAYTPRGSVPPPTSNSFA